MRVLFADAAYPQVLATVGPLAGLPWREATARVLAARFGCWDSWAVGCRKAGAESDEVVFDGALGVAPLLAAAAEGWDWIVVRHPRVDLAAIRAVAGPGTRLALMVSAEAPPDAMLAAADALITPFPHYASRFERSGWPGVRTLYLPLAFDPRRLVDPMPARDLPVTFVGGLGIARHWTAGQHAIARVAETIPEFRWWGYLGNDEVSAQLRKTYQGPAWGDAYFDILRRSRLALNRHGLVHTRTLHSGNRLWYACNMRLFEATGCGALLLTEQSENLAALWEPWAECVPYPNPNALAASVRHFLDHPEDAARIAGAGQARTLREHTYTARARALAGWLDSL